MGEGVYRRCQECGGEFQAWVERCLDCDVPLGDYVASSSALPAPPVPAPVDTSTGSVDIADLDPRQRDRLRIVLVGTGSRFEIGHDRLWFREVIRATVEETLADLRVPEEVEAADRVRRAGSRSGVRRDRRAKRPPAELPSPPPEARVVAELAQRLQARPGASAPPGGGLDLLRTWIAVLRGRLRR